MHLCNFIQSPYNSSSVPHRSLSILRVDFSQKLDGASRESNPELIPAGSDDGLDTVRLFWHRIEITGLQQAELQKVLRGKVAKGK